MGLKRHENPICQEGQFKGLETLNGDHD